MTLDQQWHPKCTWRHGHFSKKFASSFKRIFFFWSVAFIFPETLLLQMNDSSRVRKRILSAVPLTGLCLPLSSKGNQGDFLRCCFDSRQREAWKAIEQARLVRAPTLNQGSLEVITQITWQHQRERFQHDVALQALTLLSSEKWVQQELAIG